MRQQEIRKLKKLADRYDDDIQAYDTEAFDYQTIKRMILRKAGEETADMEAERYRGYRLSAEYYNDAAFEDKLVIPKQLIINPEFPLNCLIILVERRKSKFAIDLLQAKYKGSFMRMKSGKPWIQWFPGSYAIIGLAGRVETTTMIQTELRGHNIFFRVLRDNPFRRDFLQYWHGKHYPLSKRIFDEMKQPVLMKPEEKMIEA